MPPTRTSPDPKVRKMRKGTHSCFECRRRKIRCIFPSDNSDICTECFARGVKCVDQEHASADAIVDQRKNLRERVSRLESLIETLLKEKGDDGGAAETLKNLRGDPFPHTPASEHPPSESADNLTGAPLMQMFDNDVLSRAETRNSVVSTNTTNEDLPVRVKPYTHGTTANGTLVEFECAPQHGPSEFAPKSEMLKQKYERTRRAILSELPPYEQIMAALSSNDIWWKGFRTKCPGTSGRYSSLSDFATQALTKGYPPQLGLLALGVGITLDNDNIEKYITLIEKEIIQDDEYCSSLEGMECIILIAKLYADIGQPRKSWLAYRRGIMFAQLQGMHRNHSMDPERDSIWWCLFQGDRFVSLMLGLPYGIADAHADLELKGPMADHTKSPFAFLVNVCRVAGKVIDRTQGTAESSLSTALDIDSELDALQGLTPEGWWDISDVVIEPGILPQQAADLRERLLSQMAFHQIRVYLHLPFMLQSANNQRYVYSRNTCLDSSRKMLQLYHMMRAGTGEPLYECKAVDFLGFTAAILVLLGLLGYGRMSAHPDPVQEEADWRMIEISMDIFQRASTEKGGMVAAQSYKVLEQLSYIRYNDYTKIQDNCPYDYSVRFAIPYFGTISIRRGQRFNPQSAGSASNSTVNTPPSMNSSNSPMTRPSAMPNTNINHLNPPRKAQNSLGNPAAPKADADPFIMYDGFYMPNALDSSINGGEDGIGTLLGSNNQWNLGAMDIDQDWNYFLNDANNLGLGMGGAGGIAGQSSQHNGQTVGMQGSFFP